MANKKISSLKEQNCSWIVKQSFWFWSQFASPGEYFENFLCKTQSRRNISHLHSISMKKFHFVKETYSKLYLLITIINQWNFVVDFPNTAPLPSTPKQLVCYLQLFPRILLEDFLSCVWFLLLFVWLFLSVFKQRRTKALTVIMLVSWIDNSEHIVCRSVFSWYFF